MAEKFPEISGEEIKKLAKKAVNKNTVKTTKTWMNVWKSWAESKGLNDNIVKYEAKELDECLSILCRNLQKVPTMRECSLADYEEGDEL